MPESPLKVHFSQSDFTGCAFYRMEAPHRHLSAVGVDSRIGFLPQIGPTTSEDICVIQRQYHPEAFQAVLHKRAAGVRIVGELDDDFWHLSTSNPAYVKYSPVVIAEAEKAAKEKGEIGQNVKFLRIKSALGDFFKCCDAVTVPTAPLAVQLRQFCKHVGVLPNYVDDNLFRKFPPPPQFFKTLRIMWTGSDSHAGDIEPAFLAVKRILDNYPHVKFVVFGWVPPIIEMFPRGQVEIYQGFPKVQQYFEFLTETPIHIGIAPLAPTQFNASKCLDYDTRVKVMHKGIIPVGEIQTGDWVMHDNTWRTVQGVEQTPPRQGFRITTKRGHQIAMTPEHRMMVNGDWLTADKIKVGDTMAMESEEVTTASWANASDPYVSVPWPSDSRVTRGGFDAHKFEQAEDVPRVSITPRWARFLGAFVGDGGLRQATTLEISCDGQDQDWIDLLMSDFSAMGFNPTTETKTTYSGEVLRKRGVRVASAHLIRVLKSWGLAIDRPSGRPLRNVCVPEVIWRSPLPVLKEFLSAYFEADGTCSKTSVTASSKHERFLRDIQRLLLVFGIQSSLKSAQVKCQTGKVGTYWTLRLRRADTDLFAQKIGFHSSRKRARLQAAVAKPHSNAYHPQEWSDEVVSVESCEVRPVDIQVHGEVFAAAGFVSHNSWIKALEYGAVGTAPVLQKSPPYQALEQGKDQVQFVEKFTEESWYRALVPYVENPGLARERAVRYQEAILGNYLLSQNIHKWPEFYNRVLAKKPNTWFPKNAPVRVNPDGSPVGRKP